MKEHLNEDFLLQLFKLALKESKYFDIFVQHLKYEYLPEDSYKEIWRVATVEYELNECKKPPSTAVISQHFRDDIEVLQVLADMKTVDVDDDAVIFRSFETFIKQSMFVSFYNEIGDSYNKGKQNEAYGKFTQNAETFLNFSLVNQTTVSVFKDFKRRGFDRELQKIEGLKRVRIPTGIDELDRATGGLETGEYALIVGDSGSGKSFLGTHLGLHGARRGYETYHAQAEGTREQVMNRYDAAFTGTRYHEVKINNFKPKNLKIAHKTVDNIGCDIHVRAFEQFGSVTVNDIRNDIRELKKKYDIKLVVIDYLDLIDPGDGFEYGPTLERFRQQKVSKLFKNIAMSENVALISFTQASSISPEDLNNPEFVITRYNIAEDKGKLRPADFLMTINRTKDEKKAKVCRLYIDKAREHPGGDVIKIKQNLEMARFYDKNKTLKEFFDPDED